MQEAEEPLHLNLAKDRRLLVSERFVYVAVSLSKRKKSVNNEFIKEGKTTAARFEN